MKPCCPKCGSIKVAIDSRVASCLEPDCRHVAASRYFKQPQGRYRGPPNQHWRDPVALTMDGYDE